MKKALLGTVILVATIFISGCGNQTAEQPAPAEPKVEQSKQSISLSEVRDKLAELSQGLDIREDDMKEATFYRCHVNIDLHPSIWIVPYLAVDKNYKAFLYQDILYVGREPLYFDKLYIKTSKGVEKFNYQKTVKSVGGEEYNGQMTAGLYKKLQEVVADGSAKFRLEGRTFGERELTAEEISNMAKIFAIYEFLDKVNVQK